jgi:hypothetical protein
VSHIQTTELCTTHKSVIHYDAFSATGNTQHVSRQATDNLEKIEKWLYACRKNHKTCSTWCDNLRTNAQRPTRILELTSASVRLRCDTHNMESFHYLTVSHMWGRNPRNSYNYQCQMLRNSISQFHGTNCQVFSRKPSESPATSGSNISGSIRYASFRIYHLTGGRRLL